MLSDLILNKHTDDTKHLRENTQFTDTWFPDADH